MKKLLFILLFGILLVSCQETDFKSTSVENPKKETTTNILNTLDTAVIKIDTESHKLYIIENNLVVREFKWYNNSEIPTPAGIIVFLFIGTLLFIGIFLAWLTN